MNQQCPFPIPAGGFVVSCQARPDNPLHGAAFMAAMARAAEQGGAHGLRVDGGADITAVRAASRLPVIGIVKRRSAAFEVYITPDIADARIAALAGADAIAIDATARPRDGLGVAALIGAIKTDLRLPVMADVATLDEGIAAAAFGADAVATTLSGHTADTAHRAGDGPDLDLVAALVAHVCVPVIAEGHYQTPDQVAQAYARGAHAVVVGTAITNPREITRNFVTRSGALR